MGSTKRNSIDDVTAFSSTAKFLVLRLSTTLQREILLRLEHDCQIKQVMITHIHHAATQIDRSRVHIIHEDSQVIPKSGS